ncbi:hypothetical protein [Priestia koreensis]|uniref:hypothetical protein n=1 Tax=Priestia koreensis TaxID=284581 RepID=UPI003458A34B
MIWIWLLFVLYAIFFAPGEGISTDWIFRDLVSGQFQMIDPLVIMMFSSLGIFPILFALLLLRVDDRVIPAWPFVLLSFGLGAFAILPYLFLRSRSRLVTKRAFTPLRSLLSSRLFSFALLIGTCLLYGYGFIKGSINEYTQAFQSSQFISIMTVDFFVLTVASFYVFWFIRKEGYKSFLCFLPILGPCLLLTATRHRPQ